MKGEIAMIKNIEGYELNIHTDYPAKSVSYSSIPRSLSNIKNLPNNFLYSILPYLKQHLLKLILNTLDGD